MEYSVAEFGGVDGLTHYPEQQYSSGRSTLGLEYNHLHSVATDGSSHYGVSALTFDSQEELVWTGNQGGHITSYYSSELQKYTSVQVSSANEVRQLETTDVGVITLTSNLVRLSQRRGLTIFNFSSDDTQDLQCMVVLPSGNLLLGGHQSNVVKVDLSLGEQIDAIEIGEQGCAILRSHPRFICMGDIAGKVSLCDPNSLKVESTIESHSGVLSDFDVHGNLLVTCGFSNRHGTLAVDRFLMVYDLRMMKAMAPIRTMFPPFLVRFVSAFSSRLCVVSQSGHFQMVDTNNSQASPFIHQVETTGAALLSFNTSTSCQTLAFGDAAGYVHLFGASNDVRFNTYSHPTEFADPVEQLPVIDINDDVTPLSTVPMPYCEGKLLSDWPKEFMRVVYRRPAPLDPQILSSMKMVGSIGYAPNPGDKRRNQVQYMLERKGRRYKENSYETSESIPNRYLHIEAKYTRMGIEDFDFNMYNNTCFAGLEANLPNSYCNNMLQVLYFIEPLRSSLMNHVCQREFCLSCELGFLFHMLDTAQGMPCQASNFLRAFRTIPEASALGLILPDSDEAKKKVNFPLLVQSWTRFLLQQLHMETLDTNGSYDLSEKESNHTDSIISKLFGAKVVSYNHCRCGSEKQQESTTLLCSLSYPETILSGKTPSQTTFPHLLQQSLNVEQNTPAWCDKCEKYQPMLQVKKLKTLPHVLIVNCGLDNPQDHKFWKTQIQRVYGGDVSGSLTEYTSVIKKACRYSDLCNRADCRFSHPRDKEKIPQPENSLSKSWLPLDVKINFNDNGDVVVNDEKNRGKNDENSNGQKIDNATHYELTAVIIVVKDQRNSGKDNIVSCIKVGPVAHVRHRGSATSQWYLFNDFTILPVAKEEAVFLNFDWKLPCILLYSRTDLNARHSLEVRNALPSDVFQEDISLAARGGRIPITFTPLTSSEMPTSRDIVAMDAEFVTLNQEETEIRSDGTRSTIRPSQLSVARISCVRGQGPMEGVPFIDDYISTQEQVVDYLTKFSGIQPGDLDASISSKHLTTLKGTYKKLRFLIDTGVIFVGHGLKNDFRVINLVVPADQIIDTVFLFQQANKRMVSLRFLAWHFLGLKIQAEVHDSIEDAKTALRLYRKYQELKEAGKITEAIKELYEKGRFLQWKVPSVDGDDGAVD